ncbi:hypothetical protein T07_1991 [Trichinella nelsoni]|uniref:Uncharacterized protein n=1 Tax=Trichinella nelsoni TaxID=6336 RepID=A0A0V0S793_9BILA|nr:hypothetical protein T07_1991 [Trichinella nelsoni]
MRKRDLFNVTLRCIVALYCNVVERCSSLLWRFGTTNAVCDKAGKCFYLTFKIYRDVNDEEKKKFKQGRHEAERRQYEVEQKKTGGAGGYLSGSILLVPAADIRKG